MGTTVVMRALVPGFVVVVLGVVGLSRFELVGTLYQLAAAATYLVGAFVIARHWHSRNFGAANTVTLTRLVGISWMAALVLTIAFADATDVGTESDLRRAALVVVVAVGTICLILDNVDGRVARRRGESSAFGARFDMETDAAMFLILSVCVPVVGAAGWWVLAIGLFRYVYVAASWLVPALRIPVPYSYARKVVAVFQAIAMLLALALHLVDGPPTWIPTAALGFALTLLCLSFGRDVVWQLRQPTGSPATVRPST